MELYDAIFYRKSIKNYSNKSIKETLMNEVKSACSNLTYINKELNIKAHVVDRGHIIHFLMGKKCNIKAPHYIVVTSDKGEDYLQNVGFALENVVLKLTSLGLATCWIESKLKREDILEFINLDTPEIDEENEEVGINLEEPIAVIAFGYPDKETNLFRKKDDKLDRKRINHISRKLDRRWIKILKAVRVAPSIKNTQPWMFYNKLKAVRVAPSIKNTQPWMFYNKDNNIYIYQENQKKSIEDMSKISMGIALRHFDLACKNYDMNIMYEKTKPRRKIGKKYFITAVLNNNVIEN